MKNNFINSPKVAFIIVAWNNADILPECLESIEKQTYKNHTTTLIDNGSTDNTVKLINKSFEWVNLIEAKENLGFAKGNNKAINQTLENNSDIKYIVLLNSDARIDKYWLERQVEFANKKPHGAIFQGTTLDYYDHTIIDSTHIYISRNGQGTQANWRKLYTGERGPMKVFGSNAAACMISRKFIDEQPFKNRLFDEQFYMYLEDVDLATRALVLGWDNYLVPGAKAYHMGSASSGKNPGFSLYMTFRNNTALLVKNIPIRMILKMAPSIIAGDRDTVIHLYRRGQHSSAHKVIKGRLFGLLILPLYIKKAIKISKMRKISNEYLWHLMNKGV